MKILDFLQKQIQGGMTQKEIAEKIGMFPQNFNQIMKGREPKLETLRKIASAFNVDVSMFVKNDIPPKVLTNKEQVLLELINGDNALLDEVIKHAEKEKLYTEIKKQRAA